MERTPEYSDHITKLLRLSATAQCRLLSGNQPN